MLQVHVSFHPVIGYGMYTLIIQEYLEVFNNILDNDRRTEWMELAEVIKQQFKYISNFNQWCIINFDGHLINCLLIYIPH